MFTRDVRSLEDIHQNYVARYGDRRHMDGQRVNATVNRQLLRQFVIELSGKSLLDVGSGYGLFLSEALEGGAQRVAGVEISDAERSYSTQQLQLETYSDFSQVRGDDQFDVVTLFEVIEHIAEPYEFIVSVARHVRSGGSLIIGTDNFDATVVKVLGDQFPKWIPHEHISLFTPNTLRSVVESVAGLRIVGLRSFTPWELLAREFVFRATKGTRGGKKFSLQAEDAYGTGRRYKYFALRRALNSVWFRLTSQANLSGEMMFVHALKA
jgi:2-polyprenyl-3-methyl-5-hydroxy-6-metoxy-1,4-benzoquinol methylase